MSFTCMHARRYPVHACMHARKDHVHARAMGSSGCIHACMHLIRWSLLSISVACFPRHVSLHHRKDKCCVFFECIGRTLCFRSFLVVDCFCADFVALLRIPSTCLQHPYTSWPFPVYATATGLLLTAASGTIGVREARRTKRLALYSQLIVLMRAVFLSSTCCCWLLLFSC